MKRQQIQLIGILVFLAAVLAAFFGLRAANGREGSAKEQDAVSLIDFDVSTVYRIKVYDPSEHDGTVTYKYELWRDVSEDDDSWYVSESTLQSTTPVAKFDVVEQMLDEIKQLKGHKPIENVTDYAQYGLETPSLIIKLYSSEEGETAEQPTVIEIGDLSTGASMYYGRVFSEENEDDTVYLLTTVLKSVFDISAESLISSDE